MTICGKEVYPHKCRKLRGFSSIEIYLPFGLSDFSDIYTLQTKARRQMVQNYRIPQPGRDPQGLLSPTPGSTQDHPNLGPCPQPWAAYSMPTTLL